MLGNSMKDLSHLFSKFQGEFSFNCTIRVVLDDDKVKASPTENCILVKPFDSLSKDDNYLVVKLW